MAMSPEESRLPRSGLSLFKNGYELELFPQESVRQNLFQIRYIATTIFRKVFELGPREAQEEILFNINNGGSVTIAREREGGSVVGFATQRAFGIETNIGRLRVLWMSTRAILEEHRDCGVGLGLIQIGNLYHRPDVISGSTQHPGAADSVFKAGLFEPEHFYPFQRGYADNPVMQTLLKGVAERANRTVEIETGICRSVYPEGKMRTYPTDFLKHPQLQLYINVMAEQGLNPDNGDTQIYMGGVSPRARFL